MCASTQWPLDLGMVRSTVRSAQGLQLSCYTFPAKQPVATIIFHHGYSVSVTWSNATPNLHPSPNPHPHPHLDRGPNPNSKPDPNPHQVGGRFEFLRASHQGGPHDSYDDPNPNPNPNPNLTRWAARLVRRLIHPGHANPPP